MTSVLEVDGVEGEGAEIAGIYPAFAIINPDQQSSEFPQGTGGNVCRRVPVRVCGCLWCVVGRDQGCCSTSYHVQVNPHNK